MPERFAEGFATSTRGLVIAPAGCGKTELITLCLGLLGDRQLILTHTHSGVRALKKRLTKYDISLSKHRVETISGFSLRMAASYPAISGLLDSKPEGPTWADVYPAALKVIHNDVVQEVIRKSYAGVFVDEYQDCTIPQHEVVCALAEHLPVRVVGDELQGIFDFAEPTVSFDSDLAFFDLLGELDVPHRWSQTNPALGEWLLGIRGEIQNGQTPDFSTDLLTKYREGEIVRACFEAANKQGSIAVVRKWPRDAHGLSQRLNGRLTSMEEVECKDLLSSARKIESATSYRRALEVIEFASICMTKVSTALQHVSAALIQNRVVQPRAGSRLAPTVDALTLVAVSDDLRPVENALIEISRIDATSVIYRRELFAEMINALRLQQPDPSMSLSDAAWSIRDRARQNGRDVELRTVSRTLLIKGLEFDHAVVADINGPVNRRLNKKELYVALTRGTQSLSVVL